MSHILPGSFLHHLPTMKALEHWQWAGGRLELDEDDVPVVISPAVAAHLRSLADVLLRNGESGAFKAYVEVRPPSSLCPLRRSRGFRALTGVPKGCWYVENVLGPLSPHAAG